MFFPHPESADPEGLLCAGGDLSAERLLLAYQYGIFPWYNPGDPILWWSPDPRCVLFPADLRVTRSMQPYLRQGRWRLTYDRCFTQVMECCMNTPRRGRVESWIAPEIIAAYTELHALGYAHSVEVWEGEELIGGLYGLAIGRVFFGESMFSKVSNASKFAFISLVRDLQALGYTLIDCQQRTQHLLSLGACTISRSAFLAHLRSNFTWIDKGLFPV